MYWASLAHKTRDFTFIARIFKGIIRSDTFFTIPGVIGIMIFGFAAAIVGDIKIFNTGWIFWAIILFMISGIIFAWMIPLQRENHKFAEDNELTDITWEEHTRLYTKWNILGVSSLLPSLAAVALMIFKPVLPGLDVLAGINLPI